MKKDIKHLINIYSEYKNIKGMADGGKVADKDDESVFDELGNSLKKAFSTPTPAPAKEETQEERYRRIRLENAERMSGERPTYSEGGSVKPPHNKRNLDELVKAFNKFIQEEGHEKYADGGEVELSLADKISSFLSSGGGSAPALPSEDARKTTQDSMRSAFGYANGGEVIPSNNRPRVNLTEMPPITPGDKRVTSTLSNINNNGIPHLYDGGDPITGDIDPNSPEGLAMIRNADYSNEQMDQPKDVENITGQEQSINAKLPEKPASELDLNDENPEDKSLEQQMSNEDFKAGEKSDETPDQEMAMDEEQPSPKRSTASEEMPEDLVPQQVSNGKPSELNDLEKAQKERDDAIRDQKMSKYAALFGAGTAKINPDQALKMVADEDKYVNLPIQKLEEKINYQQNDPKSDVSRITRDYLASKGMKVPEGSSAASLFKIAPFLQKDAALQAAIYKTVLAGKIKSENTEKSIEAANKRASDKNDLTREEIQTKKEANSIARDQKTHDTHDKNLTQTQQLLESARGNPAAAQAEKDLYSAQKANSLINLYGDYNKLSPQQVNLLVSEVAKIATGGVPTGHEQEALKPGTMESKLASLYSKLVNHPSPANAGAFIKQFKDYNDALSHDAQRVIQDKYGRVIESRKKQLGDENYKTLQDQYINRFKQAKDVPVDADLSKMSDEELANYIKLHGGQ